MIQYANITVTLYQTVDVRLLGCNAGSIDKFTRRYKPEDEHQHVHRHENLKSQ
jgi:hypothetical protein